MRREPYQSLPRPVWKSAVSLLMLAALVTPAGAEAPVPKPSFYNLGSDLRARQIGDIVTIAVHQTAEARSAAQSGSSRDTEAQAGYRAGSAGDAAEISFGGAYAGRGEIRRSGSVLALISARVVEVMPSGDLVVEGEQLVLVNGEETRISVRGTARPYDIDPSNVIASGRLADAKINYDGSGFVARSARPGLINRLFGFLGLGG